jgi:hypothetical protein
MQMVFNFYTKKNLFHIFKARELFIIFVCENTKGKTF